MNGPQPMNKLMSRRPDKIPGPDAFMAKNINCMMSLESARLERDIRHFISLGYTPDEILVCKKQATLDPPFVTLSVFTEGGMGPNRLKG